MAQVNLTTIKNWFKTGLKPTQSQFWDTWDSFWHKDEQIPLANIDGINTIFNAINNHANDVNAHSALFARAKIFAFGEFLIFKSNLNSGNTLEIGDVAVGFLANGTFIPFGKYLGGDIQDVENSWDTSPMWIPEPILPPPPQEAGGEQF